MIEYDSRRTGNGLLDTGSTPVWSTKMKRVEGKNGIVYYESDIQCRSFYDMMRI